MYKPVLVALFAASLVSVAACSTEAEEEGVTTEVTTVPGEDTVNVPTVVPTVDSIVTRVEVDTIRGEGIAPATDTVRP